jgi:hypothetical protein
MKPKKIQRLSQVSCDKWYKTDGSDNIFRFVKDPNPGWLRGHVRVYLGSVREYGSMKSWAAVQYANNSGGTGGLLLRRHGDDFDISAFNITEVDVKRCKDDLIDELRRAEQEYLRKKTRIEETLNKLNSLSVV